MKRLAVIFVFISCTFLARAQEITTGKVINQNGESMPYTYLTNERSHRLILSDANGEFKAYRLPNDRIVPHKKLGEVSDFEYSLKNDSITVKVNTNTHHENFTEIQKASLFTQSSKKKVKQGILGFKNQFVMNAVCYRKDQLELDTLYSVTATLGFEQKELPIRIYTFNYLPNGFPGAEQVIFSKLKEVKNFKNYEFVMQKPVPIPSNGLCIAIAPMIPSTLSPSEVAKRQNLKVGLVKDKSLRSNVLSKFSFWTDADENRQFKHVAFQLSGW